MMMGSLPLKNLRRKPVRTGVLLVLIAFLAFSVFAGSIVVLSLESGLKGLEARLGADVIVVPATAKSKTNLDHILLQGTTGYFYMDSAVLGQIESMEGVQKASPQIFLSSLKADCCSVSVQVIGIDQQTDFTIQPWIATRYSGTLKEKEVVIGSKLNLEIGSHLRIYNENCTVVAQLESTGTGLDTAVYTNLETIRVLLDASNKQGGQLKITGDPEAVVSAVYIKVKEGYSAESVTNAINLGIRKVEAIQTKSMITGVADSLSGIASAAKGLIGLIWLLSFAILAASFGLSINERKREFAVLRVVGASRRMLSRMLVQEAALLSLAGGLMGVLLGAVVVFPFSGVIEGQLGLPFLAPPLATASLVALITLVTTLAAGPIASGYAAYRLSRVETGAVLREGN